MALADDILSAYAWPCPTSRAYVLLAVQTIFSQITPETTKRQYAEAQASLSALCKRYEAQAKQEGLFHYQAAHGRLHTCVRDFYLDLSARLTNLAIMQPEPPPPAAAPPDTNPPLTHEDVENLFRKLPPETFFGQEQDEESE